MGDGCSGASMTNAAHTPGFRSTTGRRSARRFGSSRSEATGGTATLDHRSSDCLRWNRCSVRIVRARTRSAVSTPERGFRAGPKPGTLPLCGVLGEHAQGWCHGLLPRNRFASSFNSQSRRRQLAGTGPARSRGHVRRGVPRADRFRTPASHAADGRQSPTSRREGALPLAIARPGGARRSPGHRPRAALIAGAGGASFAHVRAGPACRARRESPFSSDRNRLGGFAP